MTGRLAIWGLPLSILWVVHSAVGLVSTNPLSRALGELDDAELWLSDGLYLGDLIRQNQETLIAALGWGSALFIAGQLGLLSARCALTGAIARAGFKRPLRSQRWLNLAHYLAVSLLQLIVLGIAAAAGAWLLSSIRLDARGALPPRTSASLIAALLGGSLFYILQSIFFDLTKISRWASHEEAPRKMRGRLRLVRAAVRSGWGRLAAARCLRAMLTLGQAAFTFFLGAQLTSGASPLLTTIALHLWLLLALLVEAWWLDFGAQHLARCESAARYE